MRGLRSAAYAAWVLCAALGFGALCFVIRGAWMTVGITPGVDDTALVHSLVTEALGGAFVLASAITGLFWLARTRERA